MIRYAKGRRCVKKHPLPFSMHFKCGRKIMVIQYKIRENEIEILRCYGNTGTVIIPREIDGRPVTSIAPYAFSGAKEEEKEDFYWLLEMPDEDLEALPEICGEMAEEVVFPDTVAKIGNYIFYGCKNLKTIEMTDELMQIGSGAFTGCRSLSKLVIHLRKSEVSCLKEITDEIRKEMHVTLHYEAEGRETAKLIFPEHYEEAVENTPARLLVTHHHGSGGYYRQCFYDKKVDYRKYDELFQTSVVMDPPELVTEILFRRLQYPYGLWSNAKERYLAYLKEHLEETAAILAGNDELERLQMIGEMGLYTREALDAAINISSKLSNPESLGYLMNEKHRLYPAEKKTFEL